MMNFLPSSAAILRRALPGLLALVAGPLHAAVLIQVDVSNPANVTFTATGAAAGVDDASTFTYDGATLLGFFPAAADPGLDLDVGGNLTPNGTTQRYDASFPDDVSGSSVDLNLRAFSGLDDQAFSTSAPAFTGVGTVDFTSLAGPLPEPGMTGQIMAGWSGEPGQVIGEWAVVPEVAPVAQAGVMGLAVLGFVAIRRGRAARRRS
ncbi:MAG: hypothetical protein ACKVYV_02675 [Limisphaerales bacterium]